MNKKLTCVYIPEKDFKTVKLMANSGTLVDLKLTFHFGFWEWQYKAYIYA